MKMVPVLELPKLHSTPLPTISIVPPKVQLDVDDAQERRVRLIFEPYQAIRITTSDCFLVDEETEILPQTVVQVEGSSWLKELKRNLSVVDEGADFLDQAKHYLVPLQDDFLEVVAWGVKAEDI